MLVQVSGGDCGGGERTLQLSEGETTAGPDAAVVLDGGASHNGAEEVDGTGGNLCGLGNAGVASGLLLARLSSVNIRDTGATALSGVRGELPGRSARGRSVAWGGQRNSQQQMGAAQVFAVVESQRARAFDVPVLVEVVLLDLLVVLDGHFCRLSGTCVSTGWSKVRDGRLRGKMDRVWAAPAQCLAGRRWLAGRGGWV